ncbi:hypothetical protein ARMGADRAFT_1016218 [Armillaria gallica]|uniref:Uncharacterized protein n=1 Tax=Armillaria gallica TaxID=47427 RepID=A0A2H3DJ20_ARMGA|nr:hypothetical protein ARMGADRAFT_1016218 [Armillaria gallica]
MTFLAIAEIHVELRILPFLQVAVFCVSLHISFDMIRILLLLPAKGALSVCGKSEFNVEGSPFNLGYLQAMLGSGLPYGGPQAAGYVDYGYTEAGSRVGGGVQWTQVRPTYSVDTSFEPPVDGLLDVMTRCDMPFY